MPNIDLVHGTPSFVDGAADAPDAEMVWSHSWISPQGGSRQDVWYVARSLSPSAAKKIASRGGAVGLWTVRVRGDPACPVHNVMARPHPEPWSNHDRTHNLQRRA